MCRFLPGLLFEVLEEAVKNFSFRAAHNMLCLITVLLTLICS